MGGEDYEVVVSAGSLRPPTAETHIVMPHRWTAVGVAVEAEFTGAHLLHLATAGCVLNDVYREGERLGLAIGGVRVRARGGFDTATWSSTGIGYDVEIDSSATAEELEHLLDLVDALAEIPRALRAGTTVTRVPSA